MKLQFSKIILNNFFSFAHAEITLSDMGYTLITGKNNCVLDNSLSNGSGKSAIFNALCFALTGETTQGISNGIENIFANPDDCWVQLEFIADGDDFVIKRFKTPKTDMKLWVNGEEKSGKGIRESSKLLASYLPDLTSELVGGIIILGQGLPQKFSNNKPAGRKEILERLTKSDFLIQSIKDKLELRQLFLKDLVTEKDNQLISNSSQIEVYNQNVKRITEDIAELLDIESSEGGIETKVARIEAELSSLRINESELSAKLSLLKDKQLSDTNKKLEISDKYSEIANSINDKYSNELSNANSKLVLTKSELVNITKEITKLNSITDVCPTCKQKILGVVKPDTSELEAEKTYKQDAIDKLNSEISTLTQNKLLELSKNSADKQVALEGLTAELIDISTEISKASELITSCQKSILSLTTERAKLIAAKENYDKQLKNLSEAKDKISELTEENKTLSADKLLLNDRLSIVQQMITLAKREFRGVLLANIIEFIDKRVKQYAKTVFGSELLNFELNENCIDISYNGKPYENLSGGEKQKIDIIIQLALRDMLSKQLDIHSNILVLDEIYDNMDLTSCQKITDLISDISDVDSVFIVSHHVQDLEITYDNNILVTKSNNGISQLSYV